MEIIETSLTFRNALPHNNTPEAFVLHHTECNGWPIERLHAMHKNQFGWNGFAYHYYVRKNGQIFNGRPDWTQGAHCKGFNKNSIGIAFEGRYHAEDKAMPKAQFEAGMKLLAYLKDKYGNKKIYGHREVGDSDCPGKYFPLEAFRSGATPSLNTNINKEEPLWKICISGEIVKRLQHELNIQFKANLKEDGYFGNNTLDECVTVHRNTHGNISKIIQERLIAKGATTIKANGHFQDGTYAELRQFQKRKDLSIDGICGRNTWKELFKK